MASSRNDNPRWLAASLLWAVAGWLFPFITPATDFLLGGLQRSLISTGGMSEELAYRVAFTFVRIPLMALLAMLIAAVQCAVVPGVSAAARRWIVAAGVGACISTLIYLPSTLVALQITGDHYDSIRLFMLVWGATLFAGFVSVAQRRATRRRFVTPGWFAVISVLAAALGALGDLARPA